MLAGLATLLKPSGIVMLPVAWAFILMIREEIWRVYLRRCGAVLAGVLAVAIPTLVHGIYLGWSDFIYATVTYRLIQQSSASVGLEHNMRHLGAMLARVWPMLVLLTIILIVRHWQSVRGLSNHKPSRTRFRMLPANVSIGLTDS